MEFDRVFDIPNELVADENGFLYLASLFENLSRVKEDTILINFANLIKFDANLSAAIGAILDASSDRGLKLFVTPPNQKRQKRALARIGFLKAFSVETNFEERENFIPYKRFSIKESSEFKEYIHTDLIQKKRFPQCTPKAEEKIIESIYEVFANAVSHADCELVYSCGESHDQNSQHMLDMTITNLGRTVPENVNRFLLAKNKKPLSHEDALLWAFEEGNTTKNIPGGLGLAILRDFMDLNKGYIQMVSGAAMLEYKESKFYTTPLSKVFPGTIVNLKFNGSDEKAYSLKEEINNPQDLL